MVNINGLDITLTRGDSLNLRVDLEGRDLPEGSIAEMTVKRSVRSRSVLLRKTFDASGETIGIQLAPQETSLLPGAYVWDVRLLIPLAGGGCEVYTPMEYAAFVIVPAVGGGAE